MSNELGASLRLWRDRIGPAAVGLAPGPSSKRRSSGLRREELAALAGVSVDYVTRLEQGRATNPSAQVFTALGRPAATAATAGRPPGRGLRRRVEPDRPEPGLGCVDGRSVAVTRA
jgi:hypothetical protein